MKITRAEQISTLFEQTSSVSPIPRQQWPLIIFLKSKTSYPLSIIDSPFSYGLSWPRDRPSFVHPLSSELKAAPIEDNNRTWIDRQLTANDSGGGWSKGGGGRRKTLGLFYLKGKPLRTTRREQKKLTSLSYSDGVAEGEKMAGPASTCHTRYVAKGGRGGLEDFGR